MKKHRQIACKLAYVIACKLVFCFPPSFGLPFRGMKKKTFLWWEEWQTRVYLKVNLEVGKEEPYGRIQPIAWITAKNLQQRREALAIILLHSEKVKSISQRQEVIGSGLKGEELSENEQFLETLLRDLKKVNVELKQILKNTNWYRKQKKSEKKQWKDLERQVNVKGKVKVTLVIKKN